MFENSEENIFMSLLFFERLNRRVVYTDIFVSIQSIVRSRVAAVEQNKISESAIDAVVIRTRGKKSRSYGIPHKVNQITDS